MSFVPNGVDTDWYSPVACNERESTRNKLGLTSDRPTVIHVGSLIPRKRPELLLREFLGSELRTSADLVFVGDGPLRPELERLASGVPNVIFVGAVRNVVDYLRSADVLVSLSHSEGLPNSILEALACGLPVVLSDIDPHIEIGAQRVDVGTIVNAHAKGDVCKAIKGFLDRDRATLASKARALALSFSARLMAERYASIYDELSRGHTSRSANLNGCAR